MHAINLSEMDMNHINSSPDSQSYCFKRINGLTVDFVGLTIKGYKYNNIIWGKAQNSEALG